MAVYDNINDFLSEYGNNLSSFNNSIASEQQKIINALNNISSSVLQDIKEVLTNILQISDSNLTKIIDIEIERRNKLAQLQQEEQIIQEAIQKSKQKSAQEELETQLDIIKQKKQLAEEEAGIKKAQLESDDAHYKEILSYRKAREADDKALSEEALEHKQKYNKAVEELTHFLSKGLEQFISTYSTAINDVANFYNQNAGTLAATLNTSTTEIRGLQQNVAKSLRDTGLSEAISNIQVMNKAAKLAAEGYTNELKLQTTATDIVTAEKLAPNLDFQGATVKNLINVFGSDFTHKFAAIQQSVQETAGSTANLSENLKTLMSDLEPVYLAAGDEALQGMADVQATLSAAIESGRISASNAQEYQRMIAELMDPSKALRSSNVAVRLAATSGYDWSNTDPAVALEAILRATSTLYGGVSRTGSSTDRIAASLLAGVYGQNTMTAAYNLGAYTDVEMQRTRDLAQVYAEKESSLGAGEYTTATERIANEAENSNFVQKVAGVAEDFPRTYRIVSSTIINEINKLPGTLATLLSASGSGGSGGLFSGAVSGSGLRATPATAMGKGMGGLLAGVSALNIISSGVTSEKGFASGLFSDGNILGSTVNWAGLGAGIGSIIPGLGTGLGALIGGGIGLVGSIITAIVGNKEATEENTEATNKQTEQVNTAFEGITALTEMQKTEELARGGGLLQLSDNNYYAVDLSSIKGAAEGMSYVPYDDYLVKAHKGEAIVTAKAANELRKIDPNFWRSPNNIFNYSDDKMVDELHQQTTDIVDAIKGDKTEKYSPMQRIQPQTYVLQNIN